MAILDFNDYSRTVWFHQVSNFWKKNIYSFSHKGLCQNFVLQWRPSLISAWHKFFFLRGSYKEQFYHVTTLFSMWFLWINIFDFWIDHKSIIGLASILNFQIKRKSQKVLETIFRNISTMFASICSYDFWRKKIEMRKAYRHRRQWWWHMKSDDAWSRWATNSLNEV